MGRKNTEQGEKRKEQASCDCLAPLSHGGRTSFCYGGDHRAQCRHSPSHPAVLFRRGQTVARLARNVRCEHSDPTRPSLAPHKFYSSKEERCPFSPPHHRPEGVKPPGASWWEGGTRRGPANSTGSVSPALPGTPAAPCSPTMDGIPVFVQGQTSTQRSALGRAQPHWGQILMTPGQA